MVLVGQKENTVKTDSVVGLDKTEENSDDIETIENVSSFVMSSSTGDGQQNIQTLQNSPIKEENQDVKKETTKDESELDLAVNEESNIGRIFNNVASPRTIRRKSEIEEGETSIKEEKKIEEIENVKKETNENISDSSDDIPLVRKKSQKKSSLESEKEKKVKEKIELRIADEIIRKSQETKKRRRSVFDAAEDDSSTSLPEMTQSKRPRREAKVSKKYAEYE